MGLATYLVWLTSGDNKGTGPVLGFGRKTVCDIGMVTMVIFGAVMTYLMW